MERLGRRPLLIWGALGKVISQLNLAINGTVAPKYYTFTKVIIAFI
jgi:hypothetical protein